MQKPSRRFVGLGRNRLQSMGMGWEFFPKQLSAERAQRELDFNGLRAQW